MPYYPALIGISTSPRLDQTAAYAFTGLAPTVWTQAGTTTATASNALNNTITGNITVGSTTGWPTSGTLKTSGGNNTEFMSFTVVDGTTLNITARGRYSSTNAVHAGVVTLSYAFAIFAASGTSLPNKSIWSDGTTQINAGGTGGAALFLGLNHNTGFYFSGGVPAALVNGNIAFSASNTAFTLPAGSSLALSGTTVTFPTSNTLQLGSGNAASPVAQTLQAQGSRAGTDNNIGGASFSIGSGIGTGTGALSVLNLQSPIAVASGNGAQTQTTGATIKNGYVKLVSYAVAGLPATPDDGALAIVTDATLTAITGLGLAPTGGGGNKVPVYGAGGGWLMF